MDPCFHIIDYFDAFHSGITLSSGNTSHTSIDSLVLNARRELSQVKSIWSGAPEVLTVGGPRARANQLYGYAVYQALQRR